MQTLGGILFLSVFVERTIIYIWGEKYESRPYLRYVALAFGVVMAVLYQADLVNLIGFDEISARYGLVNQIVTGVVIGGGANYLNDFVSKFLK